jgi:phosphohistidine phosphatase
MQVFIMRHGQAEMIAAADHDRELTDAGRYQVEQMAQLLRDKILSLDYVLVSPYVRAQQTWQLARTQLPEATQVITLAELTPSGDQNAVVGLIEGIVSEQPDATILVVSHLPLVGYLVEGLVPGAGAPLFSTAAIAELQLKEPRALVGLTHPSI